MENNKIYQKMVAGELYKPDENLTNMLKASRKAFMEINKEFEYSEEDRKKMIKKFFLKIGEKFSILPPFYCDYGFRTSIGENFYSNYNLTILDVGKVTIGDDVLIGPNVGLYGAGHPFNAETRKKQYEYGADITIGNCVWIGGHTVINGGVTIGDNVVIGSGSVVTRDIPSNSLAAGVPCRVIRQLTDYDQKHYFKDKETPSELL